MRLIWALLLLLAGGDILESEFVTTHSVETIQRIVENFYPPEHLLDAQYTVDEYTVRLESTGKDGEPIEILAQLYIPQTEGPLPVYVFGAGSSGLVDKCAPSQEDPAVQNWGSYRAFMLSIATQGYIAILPDYAGFNDPDSIQPYYVAEMAGRVLLDAGKAVYELYDSGQIEAGATPDDRVFIAGYSQGGQSIFAAKDLWEDYAPDLPVAGVIGYAPVTNQQSHMQTLPQLATYRMYAWADYYGEDKVNLDEIFADYWLPTLEDDVLSMCVFEAVGHFSARADEMYRPGFLAALQNNTMAEDYPALHELFEINNPGTVYNEIPALIVQGADDWSLPMDAHNLFKSRYCEAGNSLTELINTEISHLVARQMSYRDVFEWMEGIINGETLRNDCSE